MSFVGGCINIGTSHLTKNGQQTWSCMVFFIIIHYGKSIYVCGASIHQAEIRYYKALDC